MSKDNVPNTYDINHTINTLRKGEEATVIFQNEESLTNFVYTMHEILAKDFRDDDSVSDTYGYGHIISGFRKGEETTLIIPDEDCLRKFVFNMHKILSEGFNDEWAYEEDYDPYGHDAKKIQWN